MIISMGLFSTSRPKDPHIPEDPFFLQRFIDAQDNNGTYFQALAELWEARKSSHWIWFVFPQLGRIGLSEMSSYYAISGFNEAKAYLENETLRTRLVGAIRLLNSLKEENIVLILGPIDAEKFQACLTLFWLVADTDNKFSYEKEIFTRALDKFYDGDKNFYTKAIISSQIDNLNKTKRKDSRPDKQILAPGD